MKKTLFISLLLMFLYVEQQVTAQTIINPGFETWSNDFLVPSALNPNSGNNTTGWWDYNFFNSSYIGSSPLSVFRCDTAHSGSYSAKIKTVVYTPTSWNIYKSWGVPFIGHNYFDTLGILFNGNVNETGAKYLPGIPFTQKISTLSFYYMYAPQGGDTAECRALLVKQRSAVGGGLVKIHNAASAWTQATITFTYVSTNQPDTLYILFSSSSLDRKPMPGSTFWVDDVSFTLLTGIDDLSFSDVVSIYPNPSSDFISVDLPNKQNVEIEIYTLYGDLVNKVKNQTKLDVSEYSPGLYLMHIKQNNQIAIKKIQILK